MVATGEARWPHGLHGEGGVHEQPLGDVVGQQQQQGGVIGHAPAAAAAAGNGGGAGPAPVGGP